MRISRESRLCLLLTCLLALSTAALAYPPPDGKGGGKGGGGEDPPSEPALPPIEYQRVTISLPGQGSILDFNDSSDAVGSYFNTSENQQFGWIYHSAIAANGFDVHTLDIEGLDAGWVIRSCIGISNNGLVAGRMSPVNDASFAASRGYVLDISVIPAQLYDLPEDGYGWESSYARKVNDNGDILGTFTQPDGVQGI